VFTQQSLSDHVLPKTASLIIHPDRDGRV